MQPGVKSDNNLSVHWKHIIKNLLQHQNVCGVCYSVDPEVKHWDVVFSCTNEMFDTSILGSPKDIMSALFGEHISNLLPTQYLCDSCTNTILQAYLLKETVTKNYNILQDYTEIIQIQIKSEESDEEIETLVDINRIGCPICDSIFNSYFSYKVHYDVCHKSGDYIKSMIECSKCHNEFNNPISLIKHKKYEHAQKITYCQFCFGILLDSSKSYKLVKQKHLQMFHRNEIYICDLCNEMFTSKQSIERHLMRRHTNTNAFCQFCCTSFSCDSELHNHDCVYKCTECINECKHLRYLSLYREQSNTGQLINSCIDCEFVFTDIEEIIEHANKEHLGHTFECNICSMTLGSKKMLNDHIVENHLGKNTFYCSCGLGFKTKVNADKHEITHLNKACFYCGKDFNTKKALTNHIVISHPEVKKSTNKIYRCSMCALDFLGRKDYSKHTITHPDGTQHTCRECGDTFATRQQHNNHMKTHKVKKDIECPICFKYYTKYDLPRHMHCHSKQEKNFDNASINKYKTFRKRTIYKCTDCEYVAAHYYALETHYNRKHMNIRPYQCDICKKFYHGKIILHEHIKTHTGEKNHQCSFCGKLFVTKAVLAIHTRIHTGEKPFPCDLCDEGFISASRRQDHRSKAHFQASVPCEQCGKLFHYRRAMKGHIRKVHLKIKKKRDQVNFSDIVE